MKRGTKWLVVAFALFALATWVMWRGDEKKPRPRPRPEESEFPSAPTREAILREKPRLVAVRVPAPGDASLAVVGDPLLVAMTPGSTRNLVLEIGVLRDAPFGKLMMECGLAGPERKALEDLVRSSGLDLSAIDRVAISNETLLVTGNFGSLTGPGVPGMVASKYGNQGILYAQEGRTGAYGTWGPHLLVGASSAEEVRAAMDRLEGRAEPRPPPLSASQTYGEVYGTLGSAELALLLPDSVRSQASAAQKVELHVDAWSQDDVLVVADVTGPEGQQVEDLGRALGGALALGRLEAHREGDDDLRELLDVSRVRPRNGEFRVEVAVPMALLRRQLCGPRGVDAGG